MKYYRGLDTGACVMYVRASLFKLFISFYFYKKFKLFQFPLTTLDIYEKV